MQPLSLPFVRGGDWARPTLQILLLANEGVEGSQSALSTGAGFPCKTNPATNLLRQSLLYRYTVINTYTQIWNNGSIFPVLANMGCL